MSKVKVPDIYGHFLTCGEPIYKNNEIIDWRASHIRLDTIKSIHQDDKKYTKDEKGCIVYTYKDKFYVCYTNFHDLCFAINNYLDGMNHDATHGSEAKRNNPRGNSVRKDKEYLL